MIHNVPARHKPQDFNIMTTSAEPAVAVKKIMEFSMKGPDSSDACPNIFHAAYNTSRTVAYIICISQRNKIILLGFIQYSLQNLRTCPE